jgi:hypothetical protein
MSYTLVVVDMQAKFSAANDIRVLIEVEKEILKAMDSKSSIIFVEYRFNGPTIPSLVQLTDHYNRVFIVRKSNDDGSREVNKVIRDNRLPSRNIRICGVNTDYCVKSTVFGLSKKIKSAKLEVIAKACNSNGDHTYGLDRMKEVSKIISF